RAENERTLHAERVVLEPPRDLTIEPVEALAVRAPAESPAAAEWSPPTETPAPSFETSAPILEEKFVAPQADSHEPAPERAIEPPRRPRGLLPAPSPEFVAWTENAALNLSRQVEPIVPVKPVDDLSDGPASLVAALAYLEAEEQESADVAPPVEPTKVAAPESD